MNVCFRVDASVQIGTGHIMRCLTLAEKLREVGVNVTFICREHPGHLCDLVEKRGYQLLRLALSDMPSLHDDLSNLQATSVWQEQDAHDTLAELAQMDWCDWMIVDHYALGDAWEKSLRPSVGRIMVIDDLANRVHECDLLLDQNFYDGVDLRYDRLIPIECGKLLGPHYAMLRPEFLDALPVVKKRDGSLKRILVFFGGSDSGNETLKTLKAIHLLNSPEITVDVILGFNSRFKACIQNYADTMGNVYCHDLVETMAEFMAASDLYVGAAGITTWERCCLGLPSVVLAVASNQVDPMLQLQRLGVVKYLGVGVHISPQDIYQALVEIMATPSVLVEMSHNSMKLVDGYGTMRCVAALLNNGVTNEKPI
jgi:UDP-2,4-diacetamido-2,4,6-trideoxy-beta-L-altropyranose hydrolase